MFHGISKSYQIISYCLNQNGTQINLCTILIDTMAQVGQNWNQLVYELKQWNDFEHAVAET